MRDMSLLTTAVMVFVSLLYPVAHGDEVGEQSWFVSYAEADIMSVQVQMCGFGCERYSHGALAPLLTQVAVLRDQDDYTAVLITANILDFDRVMVEAIRRAVAPTEQAMVIGYANSTSSYIPDKQIIREGGYEGLTSQHAYFLPASLTESIDYEIEQIVTRTINAVK